MKLLAAGALLGVLTACGGADSDSAETPRLSADDAVSQTCVEVRAGIDDFNREDYAGTVEHFEKATIPARVYAKVNTAPAADALLDAVEYYADLEPADYPDAARTSEDFARNKAITLKQCASGDDSPDPTPATPV
ncbi:MAG: hypothetical protein JWP31_1585 [Aeromicrobium sp.]|nr:hypothetical protein [Aeromicrobium sp.]